MADPFVQAISRHGPTLPPRPELNKGPVIGDGSYFSLTASLGNFAHMFPGSGVVRKSEDNL
jgi:hypothetical protein